MKALFRLTGDAEPSMDFLVYEVDGETRGGFTLLKSPSRTRQYLFDTSEEKIEEMKSMEGFTFIKLVEDQEEE